jgi:hypothetical protein
LFALMVDGTRPPARPYPAGRRSRNLMLDGQNLVASIRESGFAGAPEIARGIGNFLLHPALCLAGREASDSFAADDPLPGVFECLGLVHELRRKFASRKPAVKGAPTRIARRNSNGTEDVVHG